MLGQVCEMTVFTELYDRLKEEQKHLKNELQQLKVEEKSAD